MKKIILGFSMLASFTSSAAVILQAEGPKTTLGRDACLGLKSAHFVQERDGNFRIKVKLWYRSSGGAAGHNVEKFISMNLNEGSFLELDEQLIFIVGDEQYVVATRNSSYFGNYTWMTNDKVDLNIVTEKLDGSMARCTIKPGLTINN